MRVFSGAANTGLVVGAVALAVLTGWTTGRVVGRIAPSATAPSAQSATQAGRILFMRYCAFCHGPDGRGSGLPAKALSPSPTDLGGFAARRWTDQQLFSKITAGEPGTAMPAWGRVLSDEQRWQLVAFVRAEIQKG